MAGYQDKALLAEAGLPEDAAPEFSFAAPKSGQLPTVADQYDLPARFRRYRVIGSDGAGNPIAIDENRKGEVVLLDHDDKFARTLINKTVRQKACRFHKCLAVLSTSACWRSMTNKPELKYWSPANPNCSHSRCMPSYSSLSRTAEMLENVSGPTR